MRQREVVIFSGPYAGASTGEHVEAIADAFPHWNFTIIQEFPRRSLRQRLRIKGRRLLRHPLSETLETLAGLARRLQRPAEDTASKIRHPQTLERVQRPNVRYRSLPSLHSEDGKRLVAELRPWLGLSLSAPILKPSLFAIPEAGTINVHKSLLPSYRGMPPGFWELHDGAAESGVTVHRVEEGLDTGAILEQARLEIVPYSTPFGLRAELDLLANQVLIQALSRLDADSALEAPQPAAGSPANRQPPWLLARRVDRACWTRRQASSRGLGARLKKGLKRAVLLAYVYGWARCRNWIRARTGRCHTTVLLYHRVSDRFLDPVTVGVEQFWQHLHLLKQHYDVLDLPTFLATRGQPRKRAAVVVTFDDGYEDNYLAAQLARRADVPCTFFVSTRIVGSERAFPHDLQRLGHRVPALDWKQLWQMVRWGFTVGNHTANHANLAAVSRDVAEEEIRLANDDLHRELGGTGVVPCLAYPYGKRSDITDEVRAVLPEAGIAYCLSAHGGTNGPDFDVMDIRRAGVDCNFGPLELRALIEGWMPRASTSDWGESRHRKSKHETGAARPTSSVHGAARKNA